MAAVYYLFPEEGHNRRSRRGIYTGTKDFSEMMKVFLYLLATYCNDH